MQRLLTVLLAAAAIAATSTDASAHSTSPRAGQVMLYSTSDASSPAPAPRDVTPGQLVMITGACVGKSDALQVVLSLADGAQPREGWHAMLVTDMEVEDGNLRVRVPDMPQARNHVFRVRLFVGEDEPCICEAGRIRIG